MHLLKLLGTLYKVKVNRLENLIKVKSYKFDRTIDAMTLQTSYGTYTISEKRIDNFKNIIGIPKNSIIVSVSVAQSEGYLEHCTYNYVEDCAYIGHLVNVANPRYVTINVAYMAAN